MAINLRRGQEFTNSTGGLFGQLRLFGPAPYVNISNSTAGTRFELIRILRYINHHSRSELTEFDLMFDQ